MTKLPTLSAGHFLAVLSVLSCLCAAPAQAAVTSIRTVTWNVVGLDSNNPASGPNRFPVGARVCADGGGASGQVVDFIWTTSNSNINLSKDFLGADIDSVTIDVPPNGCADAYFEVEVTQIMAAQETSRGYYIQTGSFFTPQTNELFVAPLVSQARNGIYKLLYGTDVNSLTEVPVGGSFSLTKGQTYFIQMTSYTAPGGYEQLETFSTLPNTIFQVKSVSTTYSADTTTNVASPNDKLYGDACYWDGDPLSPSYLSCLSSGKIGGEMSVTYEVEIIDVGGAAAKPIYSLIYDLSGASYHYNSDYLTGARSVYIVNPELVKIEKLFSPGQITPSGTSTLIFTLDNSENGGAMSGVSFSDTFPTSPGAMTVADTTVENNCGGTVKDQFGADLAVGSTGISLTGGTIPGGSTCTIKVKVTATPLGTYNNSSGNIFVGTLDTGDNATDSLEVSSNPIPSQTCGYAVAQWLFPTGFNTTTPAPSSGSGSALAGAGVNATNSTTTADAGTQSWRSNGGIATGATLTIANNDYFQFAIDTTGYTEVELTFSVKRTANGPKGVAVYWGTTSGSPTNFLWGTATGISSTAWFTSNGSPPGGLGGTIKVPGGAGTKYVQIFFYNAVNSNPGSDVLLDVVTFTGCTVVYPPQLSKTFTPDLIGVDGTSSLSFTVTNPNSGIALSGVTFTDVLPAGVTVADGSSAACGGTLTTTEPSTITLSGGTLTKGGNCPFSVNVTGAAVGVHDNVSGYVTSTTSGTYIDMANGSATDTLTVRLNPTIEKSFSPTNIYTTASASNNYSTLTFTIVNPDTKNAISGVAFTDDFKNPPTTDTEIVVATASNYATSISGCNYGGATPTLTATAGSDTVSLSGASIAAGGTCTITVNVESGTAGFYTNTSGPVTHTIGGTSYGRDTASNVLNVTVPNVSIALLKQVGPTASGPWVTSPPPPALQTKLIVEPSSEIYYRFTVENTGDVPLNNITVTENSDESGLVNINSCTWIDGDSTTLSPFTTLPVADGAGHHIATCILGPYTAPNPNPVRDYINTATAYGENGTSNDSDSSRAIFGISALDLTKSVTETSYLDIGETLNYSYLVQNNGTATLYGPILLSDNKIASVSCPAIDQVGESLVAGASTTCTATYTVTDTDVDNGAVVNVARARLQTAAPVTNIYSPTSTASVAMPAADLTLVKTNDVSGLAPDATFNWTLTAANAAAGGHAFFFDGEVLLRDQLPASGAGYGTLVVTSTDVVGTIDCSVNGTTKDLTCTANGTVKIPRGKGFTVSVPVTIATIGTLYNPRKISSSPDVFGVCKIDPNTVVSESNEGNNTCSDNVQIGQPLVTILKSADKSATGAAPGEIITYTIQLENTGNGVGKTVVLRDDVSPYTILKLDYDDAGPLTTAFSFTDTTAAPGTSGLSIVKTEYSTDNGTTWVDWSVTPPPDPDADGYNGDITNWKLTLTSPTDKFKLGGKVQVTYKMKVE